MERKGMVRCVLIALMVGGVVGNVVGGLDGMSGVRSTYPGRFREVGKNKLRIRDDPASAVTQKGKPLEVGVYIPYALDTPVEKVNYSIGTMDGKTMPGTSDAQYERSLRDVDELCRVIGNGTWGCGDKISWTRVPWDDAGTVGRVDQYYRNIKARPFAASNPEDKPVVRKTYDEIGRELGQGGGQREGGWVKL